MRSQRPIVVVSPLAILACALVAPLSAQEWRELGPAPITTGPYTGRVAAIAPSARNANLWYVGGADGGVWKTSDAGTTWKPIGDFLPTTSVGALAVDPGNDNIVYVGTGEANFAHHSRYGVGIAKSTDGGTTWKIHGATTFGGRCISRLRIDPKQPKTIYASVTHAGGFLPPKTAGRGHPGVNGPLGVFKSTDAGVTWKQLAGGLPTTVSATDLVMDPTKPSTLYAAIGDIFGNAANGIYRSTNGGTSWTKLSRGLPTAGFGRVSLAIAASQPSRLVAIYVTQTSASARDRGTYGVYRSDDGGNNWVRLSRAGNFQASYGWYLSVAQIDPKNPNAIVLGGFSMRRSTDGGATFSTRTPPHVDLHALEFDAAGRLVCGDDGGVHVSSNLGGSWSARNQGLGLVQFYAGMSLHPSQRDTVYGGFQDNGSCVRSASGWRRVLGGDGGHTGVDPSGTYAFVEFQGTGRIYRSVNGGSFRWSGSGIASFDRNCFLCPFAISQSNGQRMIYGTQRVYLSTNSGASWSPISGDLTGGSPAAIHGIEIAPSNPQVFYVKTNDGRVVVSEDGGRTWNVRRSGIPGWFRTTRPFAVHPRDPRKVWVGVGWFGTDQVLYSADAGRTWKALDGNLPDIPVHCIRVDARQLEPPVMYAGTDRGVWRSLDHGRSWKQYGTNLPHAAVVDLQIDLRLERIVVATQGRGAWEAPLLGESRSGGGRR